MNQNALNSIYKAYEDNSQQCIDQIQQMKVSYQGFCFPIETSEHFKFFKG